MRGMPHPLSVTDANTRFSSLHVFTVNVPSFLVKIGDSVEVREKSKKVQAIQDSLEAVVRRGVPQWLDLEKEGLKGIVKGFPVREDLTMPMQEQLIVELYSK